MAGPIITSASAVSLVANNLNITIDKPASVFNGSLLIAIISAGSGTFNPPTASGWTSWTVGTATNPRIHVLSKKITNAGSEPSNYTFSFSGSGAKTGVILCYPNADIDVDPDTSKRNGSGTSAIANAITPSSGTDKTGICIYTCGNLGITYTDPSGTTRQVYTDGASISFPILVCDYTATGGTSTGTKTATQSSNIAYESDNFAIYSAVTNISLSRTFKWNVLSAVSKTSIFKWNVFATVSKSSIFKWNVRSLVTKTSVFKWNVFQRVLPASFTAKWGTRISVTPGSFKFVWNVAEALHVGGNYTFKWNTIQTLTKSTVFKWNVLQSVSKSNTFKWNTYQQVLKSFTSRFNVYAVVVGAIVFRYNVRQMVTKSTTFLWKVTGRAAGSITFAWRVFRGWFPVPRDTELWTVIPEDIETWRPEDRNSVSWH